MSKDYRGWIIVHEAAPGHNPHITVEWPNNDGGRYSESMGYGEQAVSQAIEWWDKRLGVQAKLQPTIRGLYRVYVE